MCGGDAAFCQITLTTSYRCAVAKQNYGGTRRARIKVRYVKQQLLSR